MALDPRFLIYDDRVMLDTSGGGDFANFFTIDAESGDAEVERVGEMITAGTACMGEWTDSDPVRACLKPWLESGVVGSVPDAGSFMARFEKEMAPRRVEWEPYPLNRGDA